MNSEKDKDMLGLSDNEIGHKAEKILSSIKAIAYLFHGWCEYEDKKFRKQIKGEKEDKGEMPLIYFDKFVGFLFRLFRKLFQISAKKNGFLSDDGTYRIPKDPNIFTIIPPFIEVPGVYGPGQGFFIRKDVKFPSLVKNSILHDSDCVGLLKKGSPIYIKDIIWLAQEEGIFSYFHFDKHPINKDSRIKSSTKISDVTSHLGNPSHMDVQTLVELNSIVQQICADHIRVLGIHYNHKSTKRWIKHEFKLMNPHIENIKKLIEQNQNFFHDSEQLFFISQEAWNKCFEHHKEYGEVYWELNKKLEKYSFLHEAFNKIHKSPDEIWGHDDIKNLGKQVIRANAFLKCLYAISYFQYNIEGRITTSKKEETSIKHRWNKGRKVMEEYGVNFPQILNEVYIGSTNELKPEIKNLILKELSNSDTWKMR